MANENAERTRVAQSVRVEDPGGWQPPTGKTYRCQVYVYPREGTGVLAVAAALPGVAGFGATEGAALADICRAFKAIIPEYTRTGKIPWLENPADPEPGGVVRWVFPQV